MNKMHFKLGLVFLVLFSSIALSSGFPADAYYAMEASNAPVIDGTYDAENWATEEETFLDTITGLVYSPYGSQTEMKIEIVMVQNTTHLFVLYKIFSEVADAQNSSISVGVAIAEGPINLMATVKDRKVAFYNTTDTETHDLHKGAGLTVRDFTPGQDDLTDKNFVAEYGTTDEFRFFEFAIEMAPEGMNVTEDTLIQEGTTFAFVIQPYGNIWKDQTGHAGIASGHLKLTFEPRAFFQRPENDGKMDGLTLVFIALFSFMVSGVSVVFVYAGKNEEFAKKIWVLNVEEKQARTSLLNEIAFYNSNFPSMTLMFFLTVYSLAAFLYGIWAYWGVMGYILTLIPLGLTIFTLYDLGQRNENLALKDPKERAKVGIDMNSSPSLWIVPTGFLGLVLFMLVFIGIDVVT